MADIPMKGDAPKLEQIVAKYGDPADHLAQSYFGALEMAKACEDENAREADELRKLANRALVSLARYGKRPEMIDGQPRAIRK